MSTYTLIPNAGTRLAGTGWENIGGGTVAGGSLADGSSATAIRQVLGARGSGVFQLSLTTQTIPAGEVAVGMQATIRSRRTAGTGQCTAGPGIGSTPFGAPYLIPSGSTYVVGVGGTQYRDLTQADVDAATLLLVALQTANATTRDICEASVALLTASLPLAPTVATPTGTIDNTSRPVVAWTHTDRTEKTVTTKALTANVATITTSAAHGFTAGQTVGVNIGDDVFDGTWTVASTPTGTTFTYARTNPNVGSTGAAGTAWIGDDKPQTQAQVAVYGSAVYGAGGFDPAGSVAQAAASTDVTGETAAWQPTADLPSGTYRAYVRTAVLLPTGTVAWSAWAYSAFTVSLSPQQPPSLVAAWDAATARVQLTATGHANLLPANAANGCEDGTATGWAAASNCTVTSSATVAKSGTRSLRLSSTAGGTMSATTGTGTSGFAVAEGVAYTAVASVRTGASARSVTVGLAWYNAAGALLSTTTGTAANDAAGAWANYSVAGNAPTGAAYAAVVVTVAATGGAAELHYVDEAGAYPGTAAASTNLLAAEDASYEAGAGAMINAAFSTATVAYSVVRAQSGSRSMLCTAGAGSNIAAWNLAGLTPGQTYTLSGYVWAAPGSGDPTIDVGIFGGTSGEVAASGLVLTTSTKSAWVRLGVTFTADTSGNIASGLRFPNGNAGAQWWADSWQLEVGATPAAWALPVTAWSPGGTATPTLLVERSDDGGSTWAPVRASVPDDGSSLGVAVAMAAQALTIADPEVRRGTSALYRVTEYTASPALIAAQPSAQVPVTTTLDGYSWVKALDDPSLDTAFTHLTVDGYAEERTTEAEVFTRPGSRGSFVVQHPGTGWDRKVRVLTASAAQRERLDALTGDGRLLVQIPDVDSAGVGRQFAGTVAGTVAARPTGVPGRWEVTFDVAVDA